MPVGMIAQKITRTLQNASQRTLPRTPATELSTMGPGIALRALLITRITRQALPAELSESRGAVSDQAGLMPLRKSLL